MVAQALDLSTPTPAQDNPVLDAATVVGVVALEGVLARLGLRVANRFDDAISAPPRTTTDTPPANPTAPPGASATRDSPNANTGRVDDDAANVYPVTPNSGLTSADFPDVNPRLSAQRQSRHIEGGIDPRTGQPVTGSVMRSQGDAQHVLDAYRSGNTTVIGQTQQGFPVVRYDGVTGLNNNPRFGFVNQKTNVFIIKGTSSPSIVPTNPNFGR